MAVVLIINEAIDGHPDNRLPPPVSQSNARISDLNCKLYVLSNNSLTLQGKLDNAIREKLAIATQLYGNNTGG